MALGERRKIQSRQGSTDQARTRASKRAARKPTLRPQIPQSVHAEQQALRRKATVYTVATLEYLTAEALMRFVIERQCSKDLRVKRITPRPLQLAVRGDGELDFLVKTALPGGGVMPWIHWSLTVGKVKKLDGTLA
ncbi:hypothetical protein EI94DRAFT_1695792 [Lactarius quietus]|nr:hypothetical protein EI94DRAFT_1695792 [Lactarius quietus]